MVSMKSKVTCVLMNINKSRRRARQGQTIVIALLVLLLLAFVGGLFVTIVARNLKNAQVAGVVQTADDYAQAGIKFADDQLMNSVEGADWRPPRPDPTLNYSHDPDALYLKNGYTRYPTGNGRFLIRLTYDPLGVGRYVTPAGNTPNPPGALSRYIKIESVGREGHINPTDPTTFPTTNRATSTAKLLAYKPIGITDYARFITDADHRSDIASIGVPSVYDATNLITTPGVLDFNGAPDQLKAYPIATTLGAVDAYLPVAGANGTFYVPNPAMGSTTAANGSLPGGGAFRSNVSVRFYGLNNVYLNRNGVNGAPALADQMEINGDVILDHYDPTSALSSPTTYLAAQSAQIVLNPGSVNAYVEPSSSPNGFNTFLGAVRDGRSGASGNDAAGNPRQIKRLEPPKLDNVDPVTNMTRYRAMALNSPARPSVAATATGDIGKNGYGQVVYIDNSSDVQNESTLVNGGYTLADQWLNRTQPNDATYASKGGWKGDIYTPPGCEVIFGKLPAAAGVTGTTDTYGVTLIRNDSDGANKKLWPQPNGQPGVSQVMYIPFSDFPTSPASPNWDVVIVAEGNVRVHGIVSDIPPSSGTLTDDQKPRHITIVTNATAYIDGNLLKGNPSSSIAVLARDYVCVNTTQFLAGTQVTSQNIYFPTTTSVVANPPGNTVGGLLDFTDANTFLVQEFSFGLPTGTPGSAYPNLALYFSGQSDTEGTATAKFSLYNPSTGATLDPTTASGPSLTDPTVDGSNFTEITPISTMLRTTVDISGLGGLGTLLENEPLHLWTGNVENNTGTGNTGHLQLERVAILPMDIRIEALLYAQNKSFFVIPGAPFNSDLSDTVKNYSKTTDKTNGFLKRDGIVNSDPNQSRFPFADQPIDMKIIVSGAVSEAHPADVSAQNAWMQKWGWIPHYHGGMIGAASAQGETAVPLEVAGHLNPAGGPAAGLTIVYDPQCAFPYSYSAGTALAFRRDAFGYPLPFAPRLPVCEGMFYMGQAPDDQP